MENNYASTYRRIMSSTAIFGGAQALSVFVNIIRAKLVASILHSRGMGMSSVITNAANGLQQLSLLGLNVAAVPDISKAHAAYKALQVQACSAHKDRFPPPGGDLFHRFFSVFHI